MPDLFKGREAIHWIDNTSAISCLLHGYSGKVDSALLVNAFHLFNAGLRVRIHFEYVESKANVADLPSRQEFTYLLTGEVGRPGRAKGGRGAGPRLLSRLEDMHLELNCRRFLRPVR